MQSGGTAELPARSGERHRRSEATSTSTYFDQAATVPVDAPGGQGRRRTAQHADPVPPQHLYRHAITATRRLSSAASADTQGGGSWSADMVRAAVSALDAASARAPPVEGAEDYTVPRR